MGCKAVVKSLKAVGYIRVSTPGQAAHGESLETQTKAIESWCIAKGYELVATFEDAGISGSKMNSPILMAAKAAAIAHHGAFVVYSLSRLGRSLEKMLAFTGELKKAKVNLVSITESLDMTTATGDLLFNMLCSIGQFQRRITSELTRSAAATKKSRGEWFGGDVAYGYQKDGKYVIEHPGEQQILTLIKHHREAGVSLRKIGDLLAEQGHMTRDNTKFSATQIVRILERMSK